MGKGNGAGLEKRKSAASRGPKWTEEQSERAPSAGTREKGGKPGARNGKRAGEGPGKGAERSAQADATATVDHEQAREQHSTPQAAERTRLKSQRKDWRLSEG
eukprot:5320098-Alexandrium_andersonii.AAC.1